jgi:hypothetical protein
VVGGIHTAVPIPSGPVREKWSSKANLGDKASFSLCNTQSTDLFLICLFRLSLRHRHWLLHPPLCLTHASLRDDKIVFSPLLTGTWTPFQDHPPTPEQHMA